MPRCAYCGHEFDYNVWHKGTPSEIWSWGCGDKYVVGLGRSCGNVESIRHYKSKALAIRAAKSWEARAKAVTPVASRANKGRGRK